MTKKLGRIRLITDLESDRPSNSLLWRKRVKNSCLNERGDEGSQGYGVRVAMKIDTVFKGVTE